jgi:hypothetical protein
VTLHELAAGLRDREPRPDTPYGLYVLADDDPAAELARSVEREVFLEYFGNTPELLEAQYGAYGAACWFLLVLDHHRLAPAGMCRMIAPSPAGSKTVDDARTMWNVDLADHPDVRHVLDGAGTWDAATLAVAPGYRRRETDGLVSAALLQGIVMVATRNGCTALTATLDCVVLDLVQAQCGRPFLPFPGAAPQRYLDSPASLPVYVDRARFERDLAAQDPGTHALLFLGEGLEATVSAPDWVLDGGGAAHAEAALTAGCRRRPPSGPR